MRCSSTRQCLTRTMSGWKEHLPPQRMRTMILTTSCKHDEQAGSQDGANHRLIRTQRSIENPGDTRKRPICI